MSNLKEAVFNNLNNAVANGYKVTEWSIEEIAEDLQACASDMEDISNLELYPHIIAWLETQVKV